jgi:hypothetical protein
MESLYFEESLETPEINLDPDKNKFQIQGKSFPEEAKKFYEPILNWMEEYINQPNQNTTFEFRFDYYNSASATQLLEIIYMLDNLYKKGHNVTIQWNYFEEDDDMLEAGKEYSEMTEVPFEFIPYVDED